MKIKKIRDNMYGREIYFFYNCSQDEFKTRLNKQYGLKLEKTVGAQGIHISLENVEKDHHPFYVWVEKFKKTNKDISVLAHEVLHLTFSGLEDVGIKYSDSSEEAFTYYFDHLLEGFLNAAK